MEPTSQGPLEYIKRLDLTPLKVLKIAIFVVIALVVIAFGLQIISKTIGSIGGFAEDGFARIGGNVAPSLATAPGYGMGGGGYAGEAAYDSYSKNDASMPQLSVRNAQTSYPYPPISPSPTGDMSEAFEVTQYSATVETRALAEACAAFDELKRRTDVIFENANVYDRGCDYTFKVKHESVDGVLAWLKDMDPKELSENTYTIKRQIDDFTNEEEVLTKKRESIDATLESALRAYDEITRLATNTQNADALANIINSRISLIERMTQERISINEQLDRLARAKSDQMDRLEYTYFNVSVYESTFVDGEAVKDSWKRAVQEFFRDLNKIAQDLTVNLALLILIILQWLLYGVIALFVAKYAWKFAKSVWNR